MGNRVEIEGGEWVELRDPEKLTNRQRRPLMRAMAEASPAVVVDEDGQPIVGAKQIDTSAVLAVNDATILTFVEAWSFPVPVDENGLEDIPALAADRIAMLCADLVDRAVLNVEDKTSRPT